MLILRTPAGFMFWLALSLAPLSAAEAPTVRTMMQDSGMVEQFNGLGATFGDQFREASRADGLLPDDVADAFAEVIVGAMNGERFLTDMEAALTESLSTAEIAAVSTFYRTPLGQEVRRLEVETASEAVQSEIEANRAELAADLKANPKRLAMVERIDAAMLGSELSATIATNLVYALLVGMAQNEQERLGEEQLSALRDEVLGTHAAQVTDMRERLQTSFARTYRDLSDEDLERYTAFLETPEVRAVYAGYFAAVNEIFEARGVEIGEGFAEIMRQKRT